MKIAPNVVLSLLTCVLAANVASAESKAPPADGKSVTIPGRWTVAQAQEWQKAHPWLVGCNYNPASAINELEMWQEDTFDAKGIDRELGWAQSLGFNSLRVYLHNIPWEQDKEGFTKRIEQFLSIADKHRIGVMFVLFDACWDPEPKPGKQREPKPGLHNSGWMQCPGSAILGDPAAQDKLEDYVKGIIGHFKNDKRVHAWDIFNEPDNTNHDSYGKKELPNKPEMALMLIRKAFKWARQVNPSQPLTSGVWRGDWSEAKLSPMARFQLENSDVISFHNYGPLKEAKDRVESLRRYNRPLLCTEYMARPAGSRFDPVMGYLKDEKVAAYNWGFVAGKTQTNYPWDSWHKPYTSEPPVWFHEILRGDGTPYIQAEVDYIRKVTGAEQK